MADGNRIRLLCVDDEPAILAGLVLNLKRRGYDVLTAESGAQGLTCLVEQGPFVVVVSDMRMPAMDGAAFLAAVRQRAPDTVRMLLTGHADIESAMAAVNEGQIFRFLLKPCPLDKLLLALTAAVEQYRLITAERVLLEQTLHGSIKALVEVLALVNPTALGRATRLRDLARELWRELGHAPSWQLDVAAMLSHLAYVTLPAELTEKLYFGKALQAAEQRMVDQLPQVAEQLLGNIPRLEDVRAILRDQARPYDGSDRPGDPHCKEALPLGARLLKLCCDYDVLECQALAPKQILDVLRSRAGQYDLRALEVLVRLRGIDVERPALRELTLREVRPGMIFAQDVLTTHGVLIIARGHEATESLLAKVQHFAEGFVREPVRVVVKAG